jgi:calpain-7
VTTGSCDRFKVCRLLLQILGTIFFSVSRMASLGDLYQQAFQCLEAAKQIEDSDKGDTNVPEAQRRYLQACQLFRQILRMENDSGKKQLIQSQLQFYEEKARQLGFLIQYSTEGDRLFSQAISLEEKNGSLAQVESLYLQAAEKYMSSLKIKEDSRLKSRVALIIGRVEEIKGLCKHTDLETLGSLPSIEPNLPLINKSVQASNISPLSSPLEQLPPSDSFTPEEISVLRQSSVINGRFFQPWINGEETRENFQSTTPFCDPDGLLPLSHAQKEANGVYLRPTEFMKPADLPPVIIRTITPLAVTQDLVADCSFVCSLCIASAFEARHNKRLITSLIFPQTPRGVPTVSPSGKYLVKLFFNGVYRKVVIDDRLPVVAHSKRLLCSASRDPSELWVSLVEKAYMKLNGGYAFPGSNSGIDLHALTGWIPEQVFFEEDSSRPKSGGSGDQKRDSGDFRQSEDRTWQRILSAHKFGDCLITISTGPLTPEEEERTGLVSGHAYAVLNVQSAGVLRMLQVLPPSLLPSPQPQVRNPWARQTWKGRFSSRDRDTWTPGLRNALNVRPEDFDKMDEEGIFWIDFVDCRAFFKSFFLNCRPHRLPLPPHPLSPPTFTGNPSLFSFRWSTHALWPVSQGPRMDSYFLGANPQYCLRVEGRAQGKDSVVVPHSPSRYPSPFTVLLHLGPPLSSHHRHG